LTVFPTVFSKCVKPKSEAPPDQAHSPDGLSSDGQVVSETALERVITIPSSTLPGGFSEHDMPIGLQLAGRNEATLIPRSRGVPA
jgi:Asp-tRNA(Asn)/Glu-tRNA(Gln) amidotransferase A subunit family amidase